MSRTLSSDTQPRCRCTIFMASMQTAFLFGYRGSSASISCFSSGVNTVGISSSVDIRQNVVETPENREQVRHHQSAAKQGKGLHVRKRRCADASSIGSGAAITHEVVAIIALRCFDRAERLAGRRDWSPAHAQKMRDQGLDVVHGPFLQWRSAKCLTRLVGPCGHVGHALSDDPQALPHLLDSDQRAIVAIAMLRSRDLKFKLIVAGIRLLLAEVP